MKTMENKKKEVLAAATSVLNTFGITDVDYVINEEGHFLNIEGVSVVCHCQENSVQAIMQEVAGYIFAKRWIPTHKRRNDPCMDKCLSRITAHWRKGV